MMCLPDGAAEESAITGHRCNEFLFLLLFLLFSLIGFGDFPRGSDAAVGAVVAA